MANICKTPESDMIDGQKSKLIMKLKIRDLDFCLNHQSDVLIYRSLDLDSSGEVDYEDLYEGLFSNIPDSLIDLEVFTMFPYLRNNKPYIYIQVRR